MFAPRSRLSLPSASTPRPPPTCPDGRSSVRVSMRVRVCARGVWTRSHTEGNTSKEDPEREETLRLKEF